MQRELQKVIVGQDAVIEQIFAAIFTRGHCLLVGVPGLAKTLIVSTLAQILDLQFKRIQFTPDLMPSDITGTSVLGRRRARAAVVPVCRRADLYEHPAGGRNQSYAAEDAGRAAAGDAGARSDGRAVDLFAAEPVLHDRDAESDRAGRHLSAAGSTARPVHVQHQGRLSVGCGRREQILAATTRQERPEVAKVLSERAILNLQKLVSSVAVSEHIIKYVASLVRATRPKDVSAPKFVQDLVDWGAGPRAGQFLIHGGKAIAAMDGRFSVAIEDVQKVAVPVLRHRISTNFQAQAEGMTTEDVIARLLKEIPVPEIPKFSA